MIPLSMAKTMVKISAQYVNPFISYSRFSIDGFNRKRGTIIILHHFFSVNVIRICVGQKILENQCRANGFKVFLSTVILHQVINTNLVVILYQYSGFGEKKNTA